MQSIVGKVAYGLDGTNITFTSSEYVQKVFAGTTVLLFHVDGHSSSVYLVS